MATRPSMRDRIREQAQQSTNEGASYLKLTKKMSFFSPKAEEYEIDVIPYVNGNDELEAFKRYKIHVGIGAEDRKYVCPTSFGKKCPICDERARMNKSASADPDLIKALAPKERTLFQIIDLKEEKKGIQLFDHSYHLFAKKLLGDIEKSVNSTSTRRRSTAHDGFAELEGGQTLIATFIEKKMGSNKFYECDRIDAEDREDYDEKILEDGINLDECFKLMDYETLEAIFLELDPEDQGAGRVREEKKEDKTASRRSKKDEEVEDEPVSRRKAKKEEVEDEPAPTRRRGKKEEVEEEVEEEKPVSSRRRGKATEEVVEETEEEPEEQPVVASSRRRGRTEEKVEPAKGKCYVPGGVFGKDCDTHTDDAPAPNCYDCPEDTWKACKEAQVAMNK
jgi:hypothetical protein